MARQRRVFLSVGSEMSALHLADYPNPHRARRYAPVLALRANPGYALVYDNPGAAVYVRRASMP